MSVLLFLLGVLIFPLTLGFIEIYNELKENGYIDNGMLIASVLSLVLSVTLITKSFTITPDIKEQTYELFQGT